MNNDQIAKYESPAFLMNMPYSISSAVPNNVWMKELKPEERNIDLDKALNQWGIMYNYLAANSITYLLPTKDGLQDQVYVANLGIVLPHIEKPTVVISNYKSKPRRDEAEVGYMFFKMMGFDVHQSPKYFEGEADLKYIKDNIYIGATGIRTNTAALKWFMKKFDMKIIPLQMLDEYLYHLDCVVFPLNTDNIMVATDFVEARTLKLIEKVANIIPVEENDALNGMTNAVRCGKMIMCASSLDDMKITDENYKEERNKVENLSKICAKYGFEPVFFNLSEFYKSGAMLSCCIMHLNYADYKFSNL